MLIGARAFLGVRFTALQALGAVVTMAGVAAIAAQGDLARLVRLAFNSGDAMMLVAVVLYAGYTVALRERPPVPASACSPAWRSPPSSPPCR